MDKKDAEIIIAYLSHIDRQLAAVMSAACLAGMNTTHDPLKIRAEIRIAAKVFEENKKQVQDEIHNILYPGVKKKNKKKDK